MMNHQIWGIQTSILSTAFKSWAYPFNSAWALGCLRAGAGGQPIFQSWLEGLQDPKLDLKNVFLFLIKSGYQLLSLTENPPCKNNGNVLTRSLLWWVVRPGEWG